MCCTCLYAASMSKRIQVGDVSDEMHGALKARAASEGMSLSDFIKREMYRTVERPTMREWLESSATAEPILGKLSAVETIRQLRDAR